MTEIPNCLYVVGTPIGNLEDVTLRALRVLREVDLIAAEDTRVTRRLLNRYEIETPVTTFHEHNKYRKIPVLLKALSRGDIALVTDAGMPGISDPGCELVEAASDSGFRTEVIPGPSAVTSAIAVSGLAVDQFVFLGFLPREKNRRRALLAQNAQETRALIAFETPHRLRTALADLLEVLGDRRLVICRELTKVHEETFRGSVSDAIAFFQNPRGEFTLVIPGKPRETGPSEENRTDAAQMASQLRAEGLKTRDAVRHMIEATGVSRRVAYSLWLKSDGAYDSARED